MVSKMVGWSDNYVDRQSKYETYVLENGLVIKTFRTDVEDLVNVMKEEAEKFMKDKEKEFPDKNYKLDANV